MTVEATEQKPQKLMKCPHCHEEMVVTEFLGHKWKNHREIALEDQKKSHKRKDKGLEEKHKEKTEGAPERASGPTGVAGLGDMRSRTVPLRLYSDTVYVDGRVIVLYDATRIKEPEYKKTLGEWMVEIIIQFYKEHQHDFGLEHMFTPTPVPAQSPGTAAEESVGTAVL